MIQHTTVSGRPASVLFINEKFEPVDEADASLARVVFEDDEGGSLFLIITPKEKPNSEARERAAEPLSERERIIRRQQWEVEQERARRYVERFDESKHPRNPAGGSGGGQFTSGGGGGAVEGVSDKPGPTGVKLTKTKDRAWDGKGNPNASRLSKLEAGDLGERIAQEYVRSLGKDFANAQPLNVKQTNFPVDLIGDHELYEVKTGQVSNSAAASQWRATIGQPGKAESEWLKTAKPEEKKAHNAAKQQAIMDRKKAILKDYSKKIGKTLGGKTITSIIDPDRGVADLYVFNGFHNRIGWNSETAKAGYIGSFKYTQTKKAWIDYITKADDEEDDDEDIGFIPAARGPDEVWGEFERWLDDYEESMREGLDAYFDVNGEDEDGEEKSASDVVIRQRMELERERARRLIERFDESNHPRDEGGRFTSGGGGSAESGAGGHAAVAKPQKPSGALTHVPAPSPNDEPKRGPDGKISTEEAIRTGRAYPSGRRKDEGTEKEPPKKLVQQDKNKRGDPVRLVYGSTAEVLADKVVTDSGKEYVNWGPVYFRSYGVEVYERHYSLGQTRGAWYVVKKDLTKDDAEKLFARRTKKSFEDDTVERFDESNHPRDESGRFTSGGDGGGSSAPAKPYSIVNPPPPYKPSPGATSYTMDDFINNDKFKIHGIRDDKEFLQTWNENVRMSPSQFQDKLTGGLESTVSLNFRAGYNSIHYLASMDDVDAPQDRWEAAAGLQGRFMGMCEGQIDFGRKTANMESMAFDDAYQAKGHAKQLLASQGKLFQELGMEKAEFVAASTVGGYAWAKYGGIPNQVDWDDEQFKSILNEKVQAVPEADRAALSKLVGSSDPKAIWDIADSKYGKDLLLGSAWSGSIELNNPASMQRYANYIMRPPRAKKLQGVIARQQWEAARERALRWIGKRDFDESKHPRDEGGKFTSGGGGSAASGAGGSAIVAQPPKPLVPAAPAAPAPAAPAASPAAPSGPGAALRASIAQSIARGNPNAPGASERVSTAQPSPTQMEKQGLGNINQRSDITPSYANMKTDREMLQTVSDLIKDKYAGTGREGLAGYPPFMRLPEGFDNLPDDQKAEALTDAFIDQARSNLVALYDAQREQLGADIQDRSMRWYEGANKMAHELAEKYDIEPRQAAGVIACMSPQRDWDQNVELADRVMEQMLRKETLPDGQTVPLMDVPFTGDRLTRTQNEINAHADRLIDEDNVKLQTSINNMERKDPVKNAKKIAAARTKIEANIEAAADFRQLADRIDGVSLNGMAPEDQPKVVRFASQAERPNTNGTPIWNPEGTPSGDVLRNKPTPKQERDNEPGTPSRLQWGGFDDIRNAMNCASDGSMESINRNVGSMHKVRNFYNNIISPNFDVDTTIDTHAIAAATLMPLGGGHPIVASGLGMTGKGDPAPASASTGQKGLYSLYNEAYRLAAAEVSARPGGRTVLPRQMQSATWETLRGLYSDTEKRSASVLNDNRAAWSEYANGGNDLRATQRTILAKRIEPPRWATPRD